ncbi:MAG: PAS domain S-box protein [Gammaproteobacteria bacterium]|nr:PAS domain S-box protein [Gammaproteobacteria bacterium]
MTPTVHKHLARRILVLAPWGKDASLTASVLAEAGIESQLCGDVASLVQALTAGAGAVILAEEAISHGRDRIIADVVAQQPTWSDLPLLLLTRPQADSATVAQAIQTLGNVTLLERPIRVTALVSTVRTALRARQRQYELRDQLQALQRSETELSDFFENASIGLHWVGPDGIILRANRAELDMLGYQREEYIGRHIAEFHQDQATISDILKRLANGERLEEYYATLRSKDGSTKEVLINSSVLWEQDRFIHTRCFTLDITGRKQTERALRESQEQFRALAANAPAAIFIKDAAGRYTFANPLAATVLGRTQGVIGCTDHELLPVEIADNLRCHDLDVIATGQPREQEEIVGQPPRRFLSVKFPLFDAAQETIGVCGVGIDITEHKRAEDALRESRDVLSLAMRAGRMGAWSRDIVTNKVWWSRELEEIFGLEPGGFEGTEAGFFAFVHPDDCAAVKHATESALAQRQDYIIEFRFRHPSGEWRWMEGRGRAVYNAAGQPLTLYGLGIDITERRQAEAIRSLHTAIVESSNDAILSINLEGIILSWNPGAEKLFGHAAGEIVGRSIMTIIPADKLDEEISILQKLRRGERLDHYETVRVTKHGQRLDISLTVSPLRDRSGKIIGASKLAHDISARKRTEQRLHKQNERQRLLWEAAAVLLTTVEPDAMMRELFAKIAPHFGLDAYFNFMVNDAGDALQMSSCIGIADDAARKIGSLQFGQAVCGTVALYRQPMVATHIQQSNDPKVQLVKGYGLRVYACNPLMAQGKLLGTLSFASRQRDEFDADEIEFFKTITHYVTVAYERLRFIQQLRDTDRRKDEFLATLAHELRNPLAPIRNSLHILRLSGLAGPAVEHVCEMMDRQVDHLVRLVDDLMEVSRITRGKIELHKEAVELSAVIHSAIETSRPLIDGARHELHISLPSEPLWLEGDFVRLSQIFANLLNNAAHYTEPEGKIWLTARQEQNRVSISVRDTGMGIAPDILPQVFEMFMQADRAPNRTQGGLGIGLTLVRSLAELHGGSVEARSAGRGHGSEFIVHLPLATATPISAEKQSRTRPTAVLTPRRVLVVDDNRDAADSLGTLLKFLGADVQVVYDGANALEAVKTYRPAVVLLDLGMPGMDGYEVARRIQQQPEFKDISLIALTGWSQEENRRETKMAGFDHHLIKPADVNALQALLISLESNGQTKH